jgi:hypothetical protein
MEASRTGVMRPPLPVGKVKERLTVHPNPKAASRRALILIPGTVNYFYNQSGHRIAEALGELGFGVDITTLGALEPADYDLCVLSNISEILHAHGDEWDGLSRIAAVGGRCRAMVSLGIDCVSTAWYQRIRDFSARVGASLILDLGLFDQGPFLRPEHRTNYRFVFSGLTPSEGRALELLGEDDTERTIPWAFVGALTPDRIAMVDHLVQVVDPGGFVYMPWPAPYPEEGSPHLNQQQFERVLGRTRYQIWCSGHSYFYMEPERFRTSLLTGGVPIKIVESQSQVPASVPLDYLMIELAELDGRLTAGVFPRLRRRFRDDWRRFPTLVEELARVFRAEGIEVAHSTGLAA